MPPANLAVLAPAKPVVRVNGTVLTDRDLARELQMIFPYEKTHDGIPKGMEPEMRKGAMQMMVFEELLYQEALRRKMTVSPERMKQAEAQFRRQFNSEQEFQKVMQIEVHGSPQLMREKIRRSLLIDELLKSDVTDKSVVSEVEARAYYIANPKKFQHGELFSLQTISIIPPGNASAEVQKEASTARRGCVEAGQGDKELQGVWTAGGKVLGRRLAREHGRSQGGRGREVAAPGGAGGAGDEARDR